MKKLTIQELNRVSVDKYKTITKLPFVVVLDNVRSLYNVGSVFRTSDAYLVDTIWLCGVTGTPPNSEIHKTAIGAEFSVEWKSSFSTIDVVKQLQSEGYFVYAVEQVHNSEKLQNLKLDNNKKYAVVFGNEVSGVQQEVVDICDGCIELPQFGSKHSLNVSITAGIVIWDFFKLLNKHLL